jgi:putative oxidoreductase
MLSLDTSPLPLIGRVLLVAIFLLSGFGKITDPAGTMAAITAVGLPFPPLSYGGALLVEIGGGLMLVAGFHARIAAAAIAVFCLVSAALFHRAFGDQNQMIHFLKNLAMCGGALQVVAFGAGRYSLDARRAAQ